MEDLTQVCPYCHKKVNIRKFRSRFDETNFHYKRQLCSCGKELSIKVGFSGSGHDTWQERIRNIDRLIEEEEE